MVAVAVVAAVLSARVFVPEPLSPGPDASSPHLLVARPKVLDQGFALRLLSGYVPGPRVDGERLQIIYSSVAFTGRLSERWAVEGGIDSRVVTGDALASTPDRARVRVRFVPGTANPRAFSWGLLAGVGYTANLGRDEPGPGAGDVSGGAVIGGTWGPLQWSGQIDLRLGTQRGDPGTLNDPDFGLAAGVVLPLSDWPVSAIIEGSGRAPIDDFGGESWQWLSAAGITVFPAAGLDIRLAGTATQDPGRATRFGALIALGGTLGHDDLDRDGVLNRDDACPSVVGRPDQRGCVFRDQDGDQTWDRFDACPDRAGPKTNAGCPPLDEDGDGVLDLEDPCLKGEPCQVN